MAAIRKFATLALALLLGIGEAQSQNTACNQVTDTLYYVTLNITSGDNYPIMMSGFGTQNLDGLLSTDTADSLLLSFYRHFYYTPDYAPGGYQKMLSYCLGDTAARRYHLIHKNDMAFFVARADKNAIRNKIKLRSGETVFVTKVRVAGTFWKVSKDCPGLSHSSNERDINFIPSINECLVPYQINWYQKPLSW